MKTITMSSHHSKITAVYFPSMYVYMCAYARVCMYTCISNESGHILHVHKVSTFTNLT